MSYDAVETSAHGGEPVELYRFVSGVRAWHYTSGDVRIEHETNVYEPYPLKRSSFRQTPELAKAGLEIAVARDLPFVTDMVASPLLGVVNLTIYRKHRSDAEVTTWWKGRVDGVRFSGSEAVISCSPLGTAMRRLGLRRPAQRQCPHALYDTGCGVAAAPLGATGSLTGYTGAVLSSGVFATQPDGWWVGGKIAIAETLRFIVAHAGTAITVTAPVPGLAAGAAFTVYPGCDHTPDTCDTKFGNILNFGGAPWFPVKNPFTGDSPN